jgi:4-hydroxybenzoate polyprenyltransferase
MRSLLSHPYIRLMRFDKPTGIWLLLFPCWWSLTLASTEIPMPKILAVFFIGAVVMRSAGCVFNDIVDRKIDAQVERTRTRPIASGEVSLLEASVLLFLLLFIALDIAIQMRPIVLKLAAVSLVPVAAYPFMKRLTWWPQAFLGLTFNWGALIGWASQTGHISTPALLLYAGGIAWTLGYDTIYAHQDKQDDIKIGVKSTALLWGEKSRRWIAVFYFIAIVFWTLAGISQHVKWPYFIGIIAVAIHFCWQVTSLKPDEPQNCLRLFRSNTAVGWLLFAGAWAETLRVAVAQA